MLCNEGTAEQIAGTGLIELLFQHMADKKEDDEFVLQITFTFSKLLAHAPTCRCLLEQTDVVDYLVELLQDTNKEVRTWLLFWYRCMFCAPACESGLDKASALAELAWRQSCSMMVSRG